ncbi:pyruvate dehydrogenase (acetyl-transferring) kinase isozyme 2, mitochondrial-like isoform X2 [Mya arenaria]|uniref:pyruvate dehydrogenase (acetyl-transferring) kinase isozyme 2, mitochondrial-like isoform X2 n=1 Tax=Mya arenaria TaxID=6604 RepID=UPI0022E494B8|nr:pyruvate dehydrogenase (acetyl-transferring) kinase isozyme 2, mitochondrial-like isoform X2 [Mya arenaria]
MRITRVICQKVATYVERYSKYNPSPLSMQTLLDFGSKTGTEESSFEFLRDELLVRLANIMKEFNLLPVSFQQRGSVAMVRNWYQQSFIEITEFEKHNPDRDILEKFTETLNKIRLRHSKVVETMAKGVMEMRDAFEGESRNYDQQITYFLDRFYTNRIGIRVLLNQHLLLYGGELAHHPQHIGCINPSCDVEEVIRDAYDNARFLCEHYYMCSPDLIIESYNPYEKADSIRIEYVPSHLYHMLFELSKNAMRAVVERHENKPEIPPIKIAVCKGKEDLAIKISDQGGGISYGKVEQLFGYMFTTAPQPQPSHMMEGSAPLAGYGYGLPLSRLYARYFQGDLVLYSMEGYGMDAIIYLKVKDAMECLPIYNKTASKMYETDTSAPDWSSPSPWTQARGYSTIGGGNVSRGYSTLTDGQGARRTVCTWTRQPRLLDCH